MRFLALLITVLSVAACQSPSGADTPNPYYWLSWSSPMLDDAYQAAAEEAVSDWNTVLDRPVFAFGWHPFVSVDIQQFPYRLDTGDGIQAIGRTYRSQRFIAVSTDIGREAYRVTVEHELGHIIGLSHSSDPNDLMCPAPGYLTRVTAEDARRALEILNREPVKSQY